jgi:hypothetical protein
VPMCEAADTFGGVKAELDVGAVLRRVRESRARHNGALRDDVVVTAKVLQRKSALAAAVG